MLIYLPSAVDFGFLITRSVNRTAGKIVHWMLYDENKDTFARLTGIFLSSGP